MELATPEAFAADPHLVWEFYQYRRRKVAECAPNPGHEALARHQAENAETWIITQNVDDLHRRAGSSERLLEMHGNLWFLKCSRCTYREENRDLSFDAPPSCPRCHALARPDVVWFGEGFEVELLERIDELLGRGGVMLIVGTSGAVAPAAHFAGIARARGAFTIEVNPEASFIADHMDAVVRSPAGEVLPFLLAPE
jgi:NAD-dependent deacetylase